MAPAAPAAAAVAVTQHVKSRMPAEKDIQPVVVRIRKVVHTELVQVLVDTVELVVDTVMAVDIVEHRDVDMVSALKQKEEQDT